MAESSAIDIIQLLDVLKTGSMDIAQLLEMLKSVCMEAKPLLSYVAHTSAFNVTTDAGEVIRVGSYLKLLELSISSRHVCDVTFVSRIYPSKWFDGDQTRIERYFAAQKAMTHSGVKVRRYMIGERNAYESDPKLEAFEKAHRIAKVDLFFLPEAEYGTVRDMGVFLGDDGSGWIVESDMGNSSALLKSGPHEIEVVVVALRYGFGSMKSYKDLILAKLLQYYWKCHKSSEFMKWQKRTKTLTNEPTEKILEIHGFSKEGK